jgi:hypothetical protein
MSDRTWVEGKNVRYEDPHADNWAERLPALAAELVRLRCKFLLAFRSGPIGEKDCYQQSAACSAVPRPGGARSPGSKRCKP